MNYGLILAGGSGRRMQQEIPKQFLAVYDKPIIGYTLQALQDHPEIQAIVVVCISSWCSILESYVGNNGLTKVVAIQDGGTSRHTSIYNGLLALEKIADKNDTIVICDANRPLLTQTIISHSIDACHNTGAAMSSAECFDSMFISEDGVYADKEISRETLFRAQTPVSITYLKAMNIYERAINEGIDNISIPGLLIKYGEKVALSMGSQTNIKITTPDDVELFKALLSVKNNI
ncbi:MAG: IspD/TarI family cytidylyltransferase [Armatimonadota bacterium]